MFTRLHKRQPEGIKKKVFEFAVSGKLGKYMTDRYWAGTTLSFAFFCVILYWIGPNVPEVKPLIRVHEFEHVKQDQAEPFFLVFWFKYVYENFRQRYLLKSWLNAYRFNKYEVAAYQVEDVYWNSGTLPGWAAELDSL